MFCGCGSDKPMVRLPIMSNDYFTYYGVKCAVERHECRECHAIQLHSWYVDEHLQAIKPVKETDAIYFQRVLEMDRRDRLRQQQRRSA